MGKIFQITIKYTKGPHNITNGRKIYQMAVRYTKWPLNRPPPSFSRPSKIYPNRDFWFENTYICHLATLF
jgi:hypothetical protein